MIVQYILKVGTPSPVNLCEERELWHLYGSKKRAEELGLVQLMFACVPCSAERVHKKCLHYDQPLVYIREEDPDYEKQQEIEKEECLTIFIDTQSPHSFVTEGIPRCSLNERLNIHQCPLGDECLCYYYRYTYVLSMDFIPLRTIHRAFGRVLPEIPEFEAIPYLGSSVVRHAYRAWKLWSEGRKYTVKHLNAKLREDDMLADGEVLKSKMLEMFKLKPRKDWRGWGMMSQTLLKILKDRRITNYEYFKEYFETFPFQNEEEALVRRKTSEQVKGQNYYVSNLDFILRRLRTPTNKTVLEYDYSGLLQYVDASIPGFSPPLLVEVSKTSERRCSGSSQG